MKRVHCRRKTEHTYKDVNVQYVRLRLVGQKEGNGEREKAGKLLNDKAFKEDFFDGATFAQRLEGRKREYPVFVWEGFIHSTGNRKYKGPE